MRSYLCMRTSALASDLCYLTTIMGRNIETEGNREPEEKLMAHAGMQGNCDVFEFELMQVRR